LVGNHKERGNQWEVFVTRRVKTRVLYRQPEDEVYNCGVSYPAGQGTVLGRQPGILQRQ